MPVDQRVEVDRLWGSGAATLPDSLAEAGSAESALRLLEGEVIRRRAAATVPDPLVVATAGFERTNSESGRPSCPEPWKAVSSPGRTASATWFETAPA